MQASTYQLSVAAHSPLPANNRASSKAMMISSALTDKTNPIELAPLKVFFFNRRKSQRDDEIARVKCFSQLVMGNTDCTLSPLISFNIDYCKTFSRSQDIPR